MNHFAVDDDLEDTPFRGYEGQGRQRAIFYALEDFFRQPDGLRLVVSFGAIFNLNFHVFSSLLQCLSFDWQTRRLPSVKAALDVENILEAVALQKTTCTA